jgi:cellulose synthase/poly-beta-1,6-N-acetylglucosamine synthase-like glycosyltransferase
MSQPTTVHFLLEGNIEPIIRIRVLNSPFFGTDARALRASIRISRRASRSNFGELPEHKGLPVTTFDILIAANHDILVTLFVVFLILSSVHFWVSLQYYRFRSLGLAIEERMLALPLPDDAELPHVLVQIAAFNEGKLIDRIAAAIANLDWPKSRLHVQILDDSTDDTTVFAARAIRHLSEQGIDAILLHRRNRHGFKAGALSAGLERSDQEFICILDVDFLPDPEFLRQCIRPLLRYPELAFVQARCVPLNGHENALTRAQQRDQRAFAVELAALCWSGHFVRFHGTCAVWRRSAIEDAGGWSDDTLGEDFDLSYRAFLRGWKALYLSTLAVPGEYPEIFKDFRQQQFRWTKGLAEVALKILPRLWRSRIRLADKMIATLLFLPVLYGPLIIATILTGVIELTFGYVLTWPIGLLGGLCGLIGISSSMLMMRSGEQQAHHDSGLRELPEIIFATLLLTLTLVANSAALFEACLRRRSEYSRTPKKSTDEATMESMATSCISKKSPGRQKIDRPAEPIVHQ